MRLSITSGVLALALAIAVAWAREDKISVQIYPSGDRLPANLLRLYLVFDRPMSSGESPSQLSLLDGANGPVDRAFLRLDEELWDPTGTRLTVLFDPGRIKRGLRANLELGPPLIEGRRYTLVVGAGWRDATGRPLGASISKAFTVVAADRTSPNVEAWEFDTPRAGTRQPLVLRFPEMLDRALLASTITIVDPAGTQVRGAIDVGVDERAWTLTPDDRWREGAYELRVLSELEDVAGNNLRRVFDLDMTNANATNDRVPSVVTRPFSVGPPSPQSRSTQSTRPDSETPATHSSGRPTPRPHQPEQSHRME
jgi:hypothetical protein